MTTFVFRLKASRPDFALSLTGSEREVRGRATSPRPTRS